MKISEKLSEYISSIAPDLIDKKNSSSVYNTRSHHKYQDYYARLSFFFFSVPDSGRKNTWHVNKDHR